MARNEAGRVRAGGGLALLASVMALGLTAVFPAASAAGDGLVKVVAAMDTTDGLGMKGDGRIVAEGPGGEKVLRTDGKFEARIDLKALAVDPHAFELVKIEVKADPRAWLVVSLENYPRPGWISNWYPLDGVRGGFNWRTIWLDLKRPEEMYQAGKQNGMAANDTESRGLQFKAWVHATKRVIQDSGRSVLLRNMRFVKDAVHLDWDQAQAPYTWGEGKDLVFRYPLTLENRLDRPVKAKVGLLPFQVRDAKAAVSPESVEIAAGKTATVTATVTLPAAVAAKASPLSSEFFEARATVEGVEDSEVTILRSADPIHLGVTVPVAEEKTTFPLLPRRKDLPASMHGFDDNARKKAEAAAEAASPDDLDGLLGPLTEDRFKQPANFLLYDKAHAEPGARFCEGLHACAFLYDFTGDRKYLEKGTALLLRAAERFSAIQRAWSQEKNVALISDGIVSTVTLSLGWMLGGESLYRAGGLFNDFDLLAADMDPAARDRILRDFILPAGIQMRNHYFGLTNQQDVANYPVLYAGLAARNWPLAGFAYAAEHGILGQVQWGFDEDGLCNEGHYQTACIRPILWATELLRHAAGIDLYDKRLYTILHSAAAAAIDMSFGRLDPVCLAYLDETRFAGRPFLKELAAQPQTDGHHLSGGITQLKWQGLSLTMNWGIHICRSAHDRCSPSFKVEAKHPLAALNGLGAGTYSPSCIDQSILIVDEGIQDSVEAEVTGHDVSGPVQFVQAKSDRHFPGTVITRTFAILGPHALVVDRVAGQPGQPHTIDWVFKNRDVKLSVPLEERQGSWTSKPSVPHTGVTFGADIKSHKYVRTADTFTNAASLMTMLGQPGTEILVYPVWYNMNAIMVRRRNVTETDYAAFFSAETRSIERVPVKTASGKAAQAMGLKITLEDGTVMHAIANYEPESVDVSVGELKTQERFATDWK